MSGLGGRRLCGSWWRQQLASGSFLPPRLLPSLPPLLTHRLLSPPLPSSLIASVLSCLPSFSYASSPPLLTHSLLRGGRRKQGRRGPPPLPSTAASTAGLLVLVSAIPATHTHTHDTHTQDVEVEVGRRDVASVVSSSPPAARPTTPNNALPLCRPP